MASDSLYYGHPDVLEFETEVVESRPGLVRLAASYLHPGGGGQVSDRGVLEWNAGSAVIRGVEPMGTTSWLRLNCEDIPTGAVHVRIDRDARARIAQMHTNTHILNALVFSSFEGALVTGAQIYDDGTARIDFDLPDTDNDSLRVLERGLNEVIRDARKVTIVHVSRVESASTPGLIRSLSVAPPPSADGRLRVVEIDGVDRQACGGLHLGNTGESPPVRITKVENKGRRNRRVRLAFLDGKT